MSVIFLLQVLMPSVFPIAMGMVIQRTIDSAGYGICAAIVLPFMPDQGRLVAKVISPLVDGAYILLLIYLGTTLECNKSSLTNRRAWLDASLRLGFGIGTAVLAVNLFKLARPAYEAVIVAACAPICTGLGSSSESPDDHRSMRFVGVLCAFIAIIFLLLLEW